jgi:uncharacterized membrane protein
MRRFPISWLAAGVTIGATSMFLFDPDRGRRRRHRLEDRTRSAVGTVEDLAGKARRDVTNRAHGLAARARGSSSTRRGRTLIRLGSPERRLLEGGAGALAVLWGVAHRGLLGLGAVVGGGYLLACAAVTRKDGIIQVQKTITIRAPIQHVFRFWSQFENFPRFMEHVLDVKTNGQRSQWRVKGPAGIAIEWDAEITQLVENRTIAWRSLDGSPVHHHGEAHFEPDGDNATRISIHMAYDPPGGALGHAVAGFLLGDPKTMMDDDLLRMKSLLELGKTTAHSRHVTSDDFH